jgi:hypothetical protein
VTTWPTAYEYTMAQTCPRCGASPGEVCVSPTPAKALHGHTVRQDAGARHYRRDVGKAPWPEDRVVGKRYDSLRPITPDGKNKPTKGAP